MAISSKFYLLTLRFDHYPQRIHFCLVYTFQLDPHWIQQKPACHLNLGNLVDVHKWHITNRKCQDSGAEGWCVCLIRVKLASLYIRECHSLPTVTCPKIFLMNLDRRGPLHPPLPIQNILSLWKQREGPHITGFQKHLGSILCGKHAPVPTCVAAKFTALVDPSHQARM
ncbi:hypothetical protein J6590_096039 [Homalodisca vitripennis]|nr:hypothetical protein J6590_096039 [Homalodisca vitripennis]